MAVTMPCVNASWQNILGLKQISTGAILPGEQPTMGGLLCCPNLRMFTLPGGVVEQLAARNLSRKMGT
ncbi:hypothetical protein [Mesorhizobium huakuii]|uniref:Uncharacterized protein n=1 Tax=Mesorhizobium huakuii TaxID=28104 RepID=A0A7G6T1P2_9HYPH|nr:hypothetical protein [Mesorhizobium huakuii]QND60674.1 hypothetical protein HB778_32385 [Mesorhizobium huakuii]